jgi:hypothetical protein
MKILLTAFAFCMALTSAAVLPASAQTEEVIIYGPHGVPQYNSWQSAWDRFEFDRHHVILGRVAAFAPYRLQVARRPAPRRGLPGRCDAPFGECAPGR